MVEFTEPQPLPVRKRESAVRKLLRDPVSLGCLIFLAIVVIAGTCAPALTNYDPGKSSLTDTLAPISAAHPLGGDGVGRDVLARLLFGTQLTLAGALISAVFALTLGIPSGLLAGYFRGKGDAVLAWMASLIMAVPAIIVMLVVMAIVSQSIYIAMAILGIILAPGVFWLVRSSVIAVREELYVDAARVSGLSNASIMGRHILPVVVGPAIIQAVGIFGVSISIQAGLAFLGIGSTSQASWGAMLNDAFTNVYAAPILLLWPGAAIGLTVAALSLLGNALRDILAGTTGAGKRPRTGRRQGSARQSSTQSDAEALDPMHQAPMLSVHNLQVSYPRSVGNAVVVKSVSLEVNRGEVLGLVGESGSGKSQTAFSILGLLPQQATVTADRLSYDGKDLLDLSAPAMNKYRGRRIGYIPQEPMSNLDPSFRIGSQLTEPIRQHLGLSGTAARVKVMALLERVGISDPNRVYEAYPHQISGGMAQRVLIAGAVSCDPELLIADEPTTALDVTVQAEILDLMRSLQQERNMAMLLVTHDFGVVADLCDRVAVMRAGEIIETQPTEQLFAHPQTAYTRLLLDSTLENAIPRTALNNHPVSGTASQEVFQ